MTVEELIKELQSLSQDMMQSTVMSYDAGQKYPIIGVAVQHNKQDKPEIVLD